jgi:hypothetical protein
MTWSELLRRGIAIGSTRPTLEILVYLYMVRQRQNVTRSGNLSEWYLLP